MGWIKDAYEMAMLVREYRKLGYTEFVVAAKPELDAAFADQGRTADERNRLYACVEAMGQGKSRCPWCEEYKTCKSKKKGNVRGCEEWMLKWNAEEPTDSCAGPEERMQGSQDDCLSGADKRSEGRAEVADEQTAEAEDRAAEQDAQAAPGGDDEGRPDGGPGEERDHDPGSGEGMA